MKFMLSRGVKVLPSAIKFDSVLISQKEGACTYAVFCTSINSFTQNDIVLYCESSSRYILLHVVLCLALVTDQLFYSNN